MVAIDGTKVLANASRDATLDYERIAREIVEDARALDAAEDGRYGEARGDELPPELASAQGRRKWLSEAKRRLDEQRGREGQPIPRSRQKRTSAYHDLTRAARELTQARNDLAHLRLVDEPRRRRLRDVIRRAQLANATTL